MADLIDRDEFIKNQMSNERYLIYGGKLYISVKDIQNAPTVDTIKHARWKSHSSYILDGYDEVGEAVYQTKTHYHCSNCNCGDYINKSKKFCPECGAKMDKNKESK